jgi:signal transduction histidine kinase
VLRGEELVATVLHDSRGAERTGLLEVVLHRVGLAIEVARLRVEVRRQLTEVEASRARIVSAGQEERRRLERDLHDGAQQRLVSIGLDLRHLQQDMPAGPVRAGLDGAVVELQGAVRELRDLAQGVRPNALDSGLAPAVAQLAARSTIHTRVDVTQERFSDAIEAAAYFVVSEALTNAAKHSGASTVTVTAARENGHLRMVIADDGGGGATPGGGSGLTGLADRVEAVGGQLAIASRQGSGTRLEAVFPCG